VVDSDSQRFVAASVLKKLNETLLALLLAYHEANPLKTGLAKEELRSQLKPRVVQKLFNYALNYLSKKEKIIQEEAEVRLADHEVTLQVDEQAMREKISRLYLTAGLKPANLKDVLAKFAEFPEEQIRQVIDLLLQDGEIIKINEALYFHTSVLDKLKDQVVDFIKKEGEIDAPRFKNMTGLTRKFSIPLLEYFDKIKLTIRIDDKRILRKG
jgi:selenocysteine-specific elongation factor